MKFHSGQKLRASIGKIQRTSLKRWVEKRRKDVTKKMGGKRSRPGGDELEERLKKKAKKAAGAAWTESHKEAERKLDNKALTRRFEAQKSGQLVEKETVTVAQYQSMSEAQKKNDKQAAKRHVIQGAMFNKKKRSLDEILTGKNICILCPDLNSRIHDRVLQKGAKEVVADPFDGAVMVVDSVLKPGTRGTWHSIFRKVTLLSKEMVLKGVGPWIEMDPILTASTQLWCSEKFQMEHPVIVKILRRCLQLDRNKK